MPGPWDKYAQPATPTPPPAFEPLFREPEGAPSKPWERYSAPAAATSKAGEPSAADLDKFMRDRYSGANAARNRRQKNLDAGLSPLQIWKRSQAVTGVVQAMPGQQDISKGIDEIQTPGKRKEGLHHLIVGGGKAAALPFLVPAAIAAPIPTAAALAGGALAAEGGYGVAKLAGAEDDTADLVGDASGIVTGGLLGAPGRVGAKSRAVARGAAEHLPIIGRVLKGAWEAAEKFDAAEAGGEGASAVKPATPKPGKAQGPPKAETAAPAAEAPKGPPADPEPELRRQILTGGKPAGPPAAPGVVEDTTLLDGIAKGYGYKDFASVKNPDAASTIRTLADKLKAQGGGPSPAGSRNSPPASPVESTTSPAAGPPSPAGSQTGPRTNREFLDAELAARRAQGAPAAPPPEPTGPPVEASASPSGVPEEPVSSAPVGPPTAQSGQPFVEDAVGREGAPFGDRNLYKIHGQVKKAMKVANDLFQQGFSAKQLEALTLEERTKVLGKGSGDTFQRILFELRGLESGKVLPEGGAASASNQSAPPPVGKPVQGIVRTPNQTKAKVEYRISEADDLKTSFDPDYNHEVGHQPRDTSRAGSRQRLEQRKADMDPEAMGTSRMAGDGAPITKDGNAVTRNHGTQALKELYAEGKPNAQAYREWVAENAGLAGMTPEQVAGMKNPVLHRELIEDWDHTAIKKFADEANMSSTARMSEAEIANRMAGKLKEPSLFDAQPEGQQPPAN